MPDARHDPAGPVGYAAAAMRPRTVLPGVLCCLALAACGDEGPAGGGLEQRALERDISQRLAQAGAGTDVAVDCPGDLPATRGATIRCRAELPQGSFGITVEVTGTEGGSAQYELEVDREPS